MAKRLGTLAVCLVMCMLCAVVAGCGDNKAAFAGSWTLESGSDQMLDAASVELVKSLGYDVVLTLDADGGGALHLFGEETPLTWEATGASEGSLTIGEAHDAALELADGKLVLRDSAGSTMVFAKVEGSSSAASEASAASAASEASAASAASAA